MKFLPYHIKDLGQRDSDMNKNWFSSGIHRPGSLIVGPHQTVKKTLLLCHVGLWDIFKAIVVMVRV